MPASIFHLVVIHHGLWGSPANTEYLSTTLAKFHGGTISPSCNLTPPESTSTIAAHASTHPNSSRTDLRLVVLNTEINSGDHTYDGIDWCGERLVKDVYKEVERVESEEESVVGKLSLIGYSLGGLVVRYAVGVMYSDGFFAGGKEGGELKFKSRPKPASFTTIVTPHLGVTLTGSSFSKVAAVVGRSNLGRSGRQLYLADRGWIPPTSTREENGGEGEGLCLIEALSDPRFNFIIALRLFERIDVYANAVADLTVSYRTAAFEEHDPFLLPDQVSITRDPDHPALLASYSAIEAQSSPKTMWSRVTDTFSTKNLPWLLNPQRFPFKFPLNYLALVCLPALLPVMVVLVLHKLRSDSKVSNRRVEEYERLWAVEHGFLEEGENELHKSRKKDARSKKVDQATRSDWERKRVSGFLARAEAEAEETLREVGEDFVGSATSTTSTTSTTTEDKYSIKPNTPTIKLSSNFAISPDEHPLTETQLRIIANLNNPTLLPQVKKHLAHFGDVLNSHAVIIVRTLSIEMHKKGVPLIRALVERFEL